MNAHEVTISADHLTEGVRSPFLPGTQIMYAWDSTALGLLKTCPRLYQYTIIEGWGSRDESIHLHGVVYGRSERHLLLLVGLSIGSLEVRSFWKED